MDLSEVPTPALVVDRSKLLANARSMQTRADRLGVVLRPHLKTVKSAAIAALATEGPATVSTLREAEYFADHGFTDLVWAVCVTPDKLDRAARLVAQGIDLVLITDDVEVAKAIAVHPGGLRALVEVDSGGARTGLRPDDEALVAVGRALGDRCAGVLTHAGHSYGAVGAEAIARIAEDERRAVVAAATRLREASVPCERVSLGSTPTAVHARDATGATEMRPGVYLFMDLFQAAIGCCTLDDIAMSVITTVTSRRGDRAVVDAGGLALSKDRSTRGSPADAGYGLVVAIDGSRGDRVVIDDVHQEHGLIAQAPASWRVGDRLRILPNHACMTAAAHDAYYVVDGGREVVDRYTRCNGWSISR